MKVEILRGVGGKLISGGKGKRETLAVGHYQYRALGMASENPRFKRVSKAEVAI